MKKFDSITEVHHEILENENYGEITNRLSVFKKNGKYKFSESYSDYYGWSMVYHYSIVRALNLFYKLQLFSSEFYDIFISKHELEIRFNENGLKEKGRYKSDKWEVIKGNFKNFHLRLHCKMKIEEKIERDEILPIEELKSLSYKFFPNQNVNGYYLSVDWRMTKLLVEIKEFALSNNIEIKLGRDEHILLANEKVKEKNLNWDDYLFGYHTGICYIIQEREKNSSSFEGKYIKKVPEIFTGYTNYGRVNKNIKIINLFEDSQDYIYFGIGFLGYDEWKENILQFIAENNILQEFLLARMKVIEKSSKKESYDGHYKPSYSEFGGYMGYDDDTINDAFEGDPSNIWNVE